MKTKLSLLVTIKTLAIASFFLINQFAFAANAAQTSVTTLNPTQGPRVVVSIKPIHSILCYLMQGRGMPSLLLSDNYSPHTYQLKPSDALQLNKADLIIWVGPSLEGFLVKSLKDNPRAYAILDTPHLKLLKYDNPHEHHHEDGESHEHHDHGHSKANLLDPHLWLDPLLTKQYALSLRDKLTTLDPNYKDLYQKNYQTLIQSLDALNTKMTKRFDEYKNTKSMKNYWVYHDAYGYFENRYQLKSAGVINVSPHVPMSAHKLAALQNQMNTHKIACLFTEPEFKDTHLKALTDSTGLRVLELDPLGARVPKGKEAYFQIIENIEKSLGQCFTQKK